MAARIVAYANQKGGVGKTTTCINLSAYLALAGKRVLVVDIDPQGNASSAVGVTKTKDTKTIYNIIDGECFAGEVIQKTQVKNLDIIPATVDLAGAELDIVHIDDREYILKNILKEVEKDYDIISIDCPPSLGLLTVNALTAADGVIIPMVCEFFALEGVAQLANTIRQVKKMLNTALEIDGVVLTMKDNRMSLTGSVAKEIETYFKAKVFKTAVPRNVRLAEAPSHGQPISLYDAKSTGALAYQTLASEYLVRLKNMKA